MSATQIIRNWLIVEPPGIEFSVLGPLVRKYGFLSRENFHAHPTHLSKRFALCLNVSMGPSEHLDDTSFLTVLIGGVLVDDSVLP